MVKISQYLIKLACNIVYADSQERKKIEKQLEFLEQDLKQLKKIIKKIN